MNNQILNNADLYGFYIVTNELKKHFTFVSWRKKSIPSGGSQTRKTKHLNCDLNSNISKLIRHRNKDITIFTDYGVLRFTN